MYQTTIQVGKIYNKKMQGLVMKHRAVPVEGGFHFHFHFQFGAISQNDLFLSCYPGQCTWESNKHTSVEENSRPPPARQSPPLFLRKPSPTLLKLNQYNRERREAEQKNINAARREREREKEKRTHRHRHRHTRTRTQREGFPFLLEC